MVSHLFYERLFFSTIQQQNALWLANFILEFAFRIKEVGCLFCKGRCQLEKVLRKANLGCLQGLSLLFLVAVQYCTLDVKKIVCDDDETRGRIFSKQEGLDLEMKYKSSTILIL